MKFGALGVSIIFATGDDGAGERAGPTSPFTSATRSITLSASPYLGCHSSSYMPNFPATSPYVTAVGGVWIPPITSTYKIEGDSISGGGFATSAGNNRTQAPWQVCQTHTVVEC